MDKKRISDLTQEEGEKLSIATDYLCSRFESFDIDFIYMTEDSDNWNFKFVYKSKYDKPKREKTIIISVNKTDNKVGKIRDPEF